MKDRKFIQSVSFLMAAIFLCTTVVQAAAVPSYEAARHEAFARGGAAIHEALNYKEEPKAPSARAIEDNIQPPEPAKALPPAGSERSHMPVWQYGALAGAFTVMGILLYHWATGPGASIRNCSTCQK
jgi:hypothetical protein